MNKTAFSGIVLAGLAFAAPNVTQAQMFTPVPQASCVITRPRPVVTTQFRPQQVTMFRDVTETGVCNKQVVENVPVTTCKNVTVDEGRYQMVWVPKPVTKQVAQTVIQQQVKTVAVPFQVQRRIPQVSTQMVPVQTVQYVNETVPVKMTAFGSMCDTCGNGMAMNAPIQAPVIGYQPSVIGYSAAPYSPYPVAPYTSAMVPTMPAITVPPYQTAQSPNFDSTSQIVPARPTPGDYETVPARSVPSPRDESIETPRKTSMFTRVPSAAAVWQSQSSMSR